MMPWTAETAPTEPPNRMTAMKRGFACRCPACGEGRLFKGFLKVVDSCDVCGAEMHHHRADDLPPYITIFIVGHLVGYGILMTETRLEWPMWVHLAIWPALTLVLCLVLMQPIKGAVVGLQYALGMHGFGAARARKTASDSEETTRDGDTGADGPARLRGA
ncbi:DUF983 domain-containing protein [Microvirga puerhi]|uniref:DUF983 domain-containing protein n=1 Tax=Microvirga puerhi TaxID=2876078 RepID=A0ABS7VNP7_9HYPH|nr:DUF983 domain-containing protein [Microvirga puerhi]MBZ6076854.1 DUF983 domain-containing protein [Microvirga puerhi]